MDFLIGATTWSGCTTYYKRGIKTKSGDKSCDLISAFTSTETVVSIPCQATVLSCRPYIRLMLNFRMSNHRSWGPLELCHFRKQNSYKISDFCSVHCFNPKPTVTVASHSFIPQALHHPFRKLSTQSSGAFAGSLSLTWWFKGIRLIDISKKIIPLVFNKFWTDKYQWYPHGYPQKMWITCSISRTFNNSQSLLIHLFQSI